jgi:Uma2 family endonuclease
MMVGGSNAHTIIKDNVITALRAHLRGQPCRALGEGPKVVTATATMYPDAIVVCGPIDLAEDQVRAPTVVVEVLSRSAEDHDRGAKWVAYRDLESLQHYLLIAQDERARRGLQPRGQTVVPAGCGTNGRGRSARDRGPADVR